MAFYDDARFGVIERKWFGLTKKHGGDAASGYTFATTDATVISHLAWWYPPGNIMIQKIGHRTLATLTSAATDPDAVIGKVLTRGASASVVGTWNLMDASAPRAVASNADLAIRQCKAGEYISIKTGTPQTDKGTAANTATLLGSVGFFLDWRRNFVNDGKWNIQG